MFNQGKTIYWPHPLLRAERNAFALPPGKQKACSLSGMHGETFVHSTDGALGQSHTDLEVAEGEGIGQLGCHLPCDHFNLVSYFSVTTKKNLKPLGSCVFETENQNWN